MSVESEHLRKIEAAVKRLELRVKTQRMLESLTTGLALYLLLSALSLVMFKTGWMTPNELWTLLVACVVVPFVMVLRAWLSPVDMIDLARRIDLSHHLHDRLSTALSLAKGDLDAFGRAQIKDAARFVDSVDLKVSAPFRSPQDAVLLGVIFGVCVFLFLLNPPSHQHELPPPFEVVHEEVLDQATVTVERERIEALKEELKDIDDPATQEALKELEDLLTEVENRSISRREFLERLSEIEERLFEKQDEKMNELAEALKEAAEKLEETAKEDLEKSPEVKKLVDALKKKDLAKAAEAAEELAKKLNNDEMSQKDLERLASVLEKFSDLIDSEDPRLQELMKENEELIRKLEDLFDQGKLSDKEKERLKKLKQDRDEMERGNAQKGKMTSRELKQLKRKTEEMAETAKKAAEEKKENGKKGEKEGEEKSSDFRNEASRKAEEVKRTLEEGAEEQEKAEARKMAQKQLEELREAMQRQQSQGESDEKSEERAEQMKDFLERAKGEGGNATKKEKTGEGGEDGSDQEGSKDTEAKASDSFNLGEGDRELGEETKVDSKAKDENLSGRDAKGASKSEIIKAASEEGFATTEYKDVFVDYESVVEEVMEKEKVPPGYRYYVKRYFQLIRPQE